MTDEEYAAYKKRKADEAAASKASRDRAYEAARASDTAKQVSKSASDVEQAPVKAAEAPKRTPAPIVSLDANIRKQWVNDVANGDTTLTYPEYAYKYRDQLPR